jgi:hypothetical protein
MRMHACLRSASLYSRAPATTWRSPLQGSQRRHGKKLPAACVDLLFRMQKTCVQWFISWPHAFLWFCAWAGALDEWITSEAIFGVLSPATDKYNYLYPPWQRNSLRVLLFF